MNSLNVAVLVCLFALVGCQWISMRNKNDCPVEPVTQYDTLGRRLSGLLLPPDCQGCCGSCWAFATSHTFADQLNIDSNRSVAVFSPDHLTKCAPGSTDGNGCCGNSLYESSMYLQLTGAYPDSCYPYTLSNYMIPDDDDAKITFKAANPLTCPTTCTNRNDNPSPRRLLRYTYISSTDTNRVIAALNNGPVVAALHVSGAYSVSLFNYGCGIYTDPVPFPKNERGHAVELVDYSSPSYTGTPFYVVKNSWGSDYGERGYFRIAQNSRLFFQFFSYAVSTDTSSETGTSSRLRSAAVCSAVEVNTNQNSAVDAAIMYGLQELNGRKLVMCTEGNGVPTLELVSIINATEQVVEGMIVDVTVRVNTRECVDNSAVVRLVVLQNMNGSLVLLDYSYTSSAATLQAFSFGLLLLLVVFACYVNFL